MTKIALLTNEIPPIRYGGVATWITNFMDMFKDDGTIEVIPFFLAHIDEPPQEFFSLYPDIRILRSFDDIQENFNDIDVTVNNLWVAHEYTKAIKDTYPDKRMVSVCHSLIKMEHLTNLGGDATRSYYEQEITFQYSDVVILISRSEKKHYFDFGYDRYSAQPVVIYNSYTPRYDNSEWQPNYTSNDIGYIGRHVPRKRPDLPIFAVERSGRRDVRVFNMGVDYRHEGNPFWEDLGRKHPQQLVIIPFSSNKGTVKFYWDSIGANCITGIYEPFGYTMCETLDMRVPAIVQDIDGPSEICAGVTDSIFQYHVDQMMDQDISNILEAIERFWDTHPDDRAEMASRARSTLDRFRPEVIRQDWIRLLSEAELRYVPETSMHGHGKYRPREKRSGSGLGDAEFGYGYGYGKDRLKSNQ